jgi:hypothetical protein
MKKDSIFHSIRIPALISVVFLILLLVVFKDFVMDPSKLMLNSDQLNSIGSRVLRSESLVVTEWDDSRLGGVPTIDALFSDVYHPLVLVQFITDPARAVGIKFILTIWVAFISAMLLAKSLTKEWSWGALLGFLYAFSPQYFTYIYGGHDGKMMVFAVAPLALLAIQKIIREASLAYFLVLIFSVIWMILGSHLQLTYLFLWGAGLYTLFEVYLLKEPVSVKGKRLSLASIALLFALAISSFQIIPPYLYTTQQSVRGTDEKTNYGHAVSWSLHQEELGNLIVPGFLGIDVYEQDPNNGDLRSSSLINVSMEDYQKMGVKGSPFYWGHNHFKLNHDSSGTLLTFLAFLAFFIPGQRRIAAFWFLGASLALSYAMGAHSPLFKLWYHILPGIKSFRAPSMSLFWFPLAMLMMAGPVFQKLHKKESKFAIFNASISFVFLLLLTLFARFQWDLFLGPWGFMAVILYALFFIVALDITDKNRRISWDSFLISIKSLCNSSSRLLQVSIFIPFVLLGLYILSGQKLLIDPVTAPYFKPLNSLVMEYTATTIIPSFLLVLLNVFVVFFVFTKVKENHKKLISLLIIASIELYTINSVFIQNTEYKQYVQPDNPVIRSLKQNTTPGSNFPRVLSLSRVPALGQNAFAIYGMRNAEGFHDNELASYRAFRGGQENKNLLLNINDANAPKPFLDLLNVHAVIFDTPNGTTYMPNPSAMGEAFLYASSVVMTDEKAIDTLTKGFPYRETIILSEEPLEDSNPKLDTPFNAKVSQIKQDKMDTQVFEVESDRDAFLLISGNYHPYWNAKVNQKEVKVYKAFGTLRAIQVPKGKSTVHMQYRSKPFHWTLNIAGFSLIFLVGFSVMWYLSRKSNRIVKLD